MPKVRQLSPTFTEKEAELVVAIVTRELGRLQSNDPDIIRDPFEGHPPSVRRRLVERLERAQDKLQLAIKGAAYTVPAIATTPTTESDVVTEIIG